MTTPYDQVAYPSLPFAQTHPDRLGTQAALFGLPFAPAAACRVLEIGCSDGGNLIPMAAAYPGSRFVGFDLSETAIARGQETVRALGLTNIRLETQNIIGADYGEGEYDYVIAHGLYAWVPEPVREAMMALIRRSLAPHGIGYVSYNALPGAGLRQMVREMLVFELRGVEGPAERVAAARAWLEKALKLYSAEELTLITVRETCQSMLDRDPSVLAHDELGEVFEPMMFHQVMSHAQSHGLQFLTEADTTRSGEGFRPPYALDQDDFDVTAHAQELDFEVLRGFRQTLLVRSEITLDRRPDPSRLKGLHIAASVEEVQPGVFESSKVRFGLNDDRLTTVVKRLNEVWPTPLPVRGLIDDEERLGAVLRMFWVGAVELHAQPWPLSVKIAERPAVSPFARWQANQGRSVLTTLFHGVVEITDDIGLSFIAGLDGSRTVDELADNMTISRDEMLGKLNGIARLGLLA